MIKNILFDVGRVLLSYDPDGMMRGLGYDKETREAVCAAMFGNPLWNEFDRGKMEDEVLLQGFVSNHEAYEEQIREAFETMPYSMELFPYVMEWLLRLKREGYRLYLLSNYARRNFERTREKMKFLDMVDGGVFSFQCGWTKPEPEIYVYLFETYGLNPKECVFLDDTKENVVAARRLGAQGIEFVSYDQAAAELDELLKKG